MSRHPGLRPAVVLAVITAAGATLAARRLFPVRVAGDSMIPTLRPGDLLAVRSSTTVVARGSIVVLEGVAGPEIVKRIVAVAGDRYLDEPVRKGFVAVGGDNSTSSTDSRHFGPVPIGRIKGIVRAVYWPPPRWRLL